MKRVFVAAAVAALALLTFFQFPGHTWLQQDSQIYAPILEHLRDPSVLRNDMLVDGQHLAFTLYDEAAELLRTLTGLGFREVLAAGQIVTRALGIWGLYLMATAAGLAAGPALAAAAIVSLGAMTLGPQVLTFEYEPIPRGLALLLMVCAVGLASHRRYLGAGLAASVAVLVHAPTACPFWGLYLVLALFPAEPPVRKRRWYGLLPLAAGAAVLFVASRRQAGAGESQVFFSTLTALQVKLQLMRTAYVRVSAWGPALAAHYLVVTAVLVGAYLRIRRRLSPELRFFVCGLPLIGLASVPASYLLLERMGWSLIPQFQPLRALLFLVLMMQFTAAVAALAAGLERHSAEAAGWFLAAYSLPLAGRLDVLPPWRAALALALLAAVATLAMSRRGRRGERVALAAVVLAGFWLAPWVGGVVNYPRLHTPELAELSRWAGASTPKDSLFLFADAPRSLDPGVFRILALRAVYVDWKGGGQINYLKDLGERWWLRWQQTLAAGFRPADLPRYGALGIHYVVLQSRNRVAGQTPLFENARYLVYRMAPGAAPDARQ
jgi:hypothetical protein